MSQPSKESIFLVDPVARRRESTAKRLRLTYEVHEASTVTEAVHRFENGFRPDAVVATLQQDHDDGLSLGLAARLMLGKRTYILVHGPGPASAEDRDRQARTHKVDTWAQGVLDGQGIEALLRAKPGTTPDEVPSSTRRAQPRPARPASAPGTWTVLVVDPVVQRLDGVLGLLGGPFHVVTASTPADAMRALDRGLVPHAVVATVRQERDNGLLLCHAIRDRLGETVYLVVHGPAHLHGVDRPQLAAQHQVDAWVPVVLDPHALGLLLRTELGRRQREQAPPPESWERTDDEPTWGDLMRAPVTRRTLRKFLTKDLFGRQRPPRH